MSEEPEMPSWNEIANAAKGYEWLPGPARWTNAEARALHDQLHEKIQKIAADYQRMMLLEIEPYQKQMVDLYCKFATPTLYPAPIALRKIKE